MSQRDPFYQQLYPTNATVPSMQPTSTYIQSASQPVSQVSMSSHLNEPSLQAVREIVRVEVRKALNEIITEIRMQTGARE